MIASVNKMCEAGNIVNLDEEGGSIVNCQTKATIPIHRENGMYYLYLEVAQDFRAA